jgi:glucan phosphoethanolaminetransferase (alkaline phosphatase superfamily)
MSSTKKNTSTAIAFLLIIFIISISDLIYFIINEPHTDAFFRFFTCLSAFLIPLYLFRNYLKLYLWLLMPVFLLIPVSISAIIFFNLPINETLVLSITNTTQKEAMELARHYVLIFVFFAFAVIGVYIFLIRRAPARIPARLSLVISLCSLLVFLIVPLFDRNPEYVDRGYFIRIKANLYNTFPFSVAYCSGLVYKQYHLIKEAETERKDFTFNARQTPLGVAGKQIYILLIGESCRADHWNINGYSRNTSPKMNKRENLITFSNASAGATFTEFAVPQLITCATPDNFYEHFRQRSIVSVFKEAGFDTYWVTDQEDAAHIRIHELEADHIYIQRQRPSQEVQMQNTDMELVRIVNKILQEPGDKKFIVMHTWGSHFDYAERYPDSYDVFQPSLKTVFARPSDFSKKDVLVNSYDNSVLFTDAVIDSTITLLKDQPAISALYYIADHGENLFDDGSHVSLHEEIIPTLYTAHIPFFIWYSDTLRNIFPQKIEMLSRHRSSKIGVEDIIHTVTDMSNIHFPLQDPAKCIDLGSFADSRQEILSENLKIYFYDSLKRKK